MPKDAVDDSGIRNEGDDAHAAAARAQQGIRLEGSLSAHRFMSRAQLLRRQRARQSQRCSGAAAEAHRSGNLTLFDQSDVLD
jgi:hypothetical protein